MKLFKVTLTPVTYDLFDSAVIACESREDLKQMLDDKRFTGRLSNDNKILYNDKNGFELDDYFPQTVVSILEIGESTIDYGDYDAVVVCSSFNAG